MPAFTASASAISRRPRERRLIDGPPRLYASDAPEAELQAVMRRAFLPTDRLTLNLNRLLIETDGRRALLEAGAGQTKTRTAVRFFRNPGRAQAEAIVFGR